MILLIGNSIPTPTIPIDVIWEGFIVEKVGVKTRDIQFYSEKGGIIIKVHSKQARDYAKWLEGETWVEERRGKGKGAESGMGGDGGDVQRVRKLNRGV